MPIGVFTASRWVGFGLLYAKRDPYGRARWSVHYMKLGATPK